MKAVILAAGQGTRLRPLTDDMPKCMVKIQGISMIERDIDTMCECGLKEEDIYIVTGYRTEVLEEFLKDKRVNFIYNAAYDSTNMVCSLLCAKEILQKEEDVIISYGDIIYENSVFEKIQSTEYEISVIIDDGWCDYWEKRCENPLEDAETLRFDKDDNLIEIGQKTDDITRVQSQYIGLLHFKGNGIQKVLNICEEAKRRSINQEKLWRTDRTYYKMYMTDMLQGLIDEGNEIKALHIQRGWYEVDSVQDLKVVEEELGKRAGM